jgi:cell division protein FtsQ
VLVASGLRTAVAADGVVLGPLLAGSSLPTVAGSFVAPVGSHLQNPQLIEAMAVLGAAPHTFSGLLARAYAGPRGLTVAMRNGLLVYFGDAGRPHAKWASLASVLADPSSAGASYIDVRLPGRPSAGFGTAATAETQTSAAPGAGKGSSEGTVSALAAGLKAATPQTSTTPAETKQASSGETAAGAASGEEGNSASSSGEASEGTPATPGG